MDLIEKTLSSEKIYDGRFISLRRDHILLPDGREAAREVIEHPGAICVLPLTEEGEVILVRQYRSAAARIVTELPAGKLDPGEHPILCAQRELMEETGFSCREMISLGRMMPTPGYCEEVIWMYLARGLKPGQTSPDDDEFLEIVRIPLEELTARILANEFDDAKTQLGVLKAVAYLEAEKKHTY